MQFIAILLLIILAKMGYDIYREQQQKIKPKSKKTGQVIDISDTWINMDKLPYRKKDFLLNNRELAVYDSLDHLLNGTAYRLFTKVPLSDFMQTAADAVNRQEYNQRIIERNADFLVCQSPELTPLLVIMIESQNDAKRKQLVDRFTRQAAETAGLAFITLNPANLPETEELKNRLIAAGLSL